MFVALYSKIKLYLPERWRYVLEHQGVKKYSANTGWMFLGQLFSLLVSFFIGIWLARYLGPENFGVLSYALAFAGLFAFLSDFGVSSILNRDLVLFPQKRDTLLGTSFVLKIVGGVVAFFAVCLSVVVLKVSPINTLLILLFATSFVIQAFNVINTFFYASVESKKNVHVVMLATTISSVLKIAMIVFGQGVIWLMCVYVLDFVWQSIGFIVSYYRSGFSIRTWTFRGEVAKDLLKQSWPLMFAAAASFIYLRIDQVMIGWMLGEQEVGIYAVAVKLVEIWYFIPAMLCGSLFPAIVNAKKTNQSQYHKRMKALYILLFSISVGIALPLSVLAPWIVSILFGDAFVTAVGVLQIYCWSSVGMFIGVAITQYFLSEHKTLYTLYFNITSMLINIVLNIIFISYIGLLGAALATLVSYSVGPACVGVIFWYQKYYVRNTLLIH